MYSSVQYRYSGVHVCGIQVVFYRYSDVQVQCCTGTWVNSYNAVHEECFRGTMLYRYCAVVYRYNTVHLHCFTATVLYRFSALYAQ